MLFFNLYGNVITEEIRLVSFNLGGEKLKLSQPYKGILYLIFAITVFLFAGSVPLKAQNQEDLQEPLNPEAVSTAVADSARVDESAIILGEGPDLPAVPTGGSTVFVVLRMVLVLALAALAIYGVVFFIKRIARPQEIRDPHLKVLARIPLSNDSYAAVISLGTKAWLVGGGGGSVSLISEIDDKDSLEAMLLDESDRAASYESRRIIDFRTLLSRFGSLKEKSPVPNSNRFQSDSFQSDGLQAEFLRKQRERLGER